MLGLIVVFKYILLLILLLPVPNHCYCCQIKKKERRRQTTTTQHQYRPGCWEWNMSNSKMCIFKCVFNASGLFFFCLFVKCVAVKNERNNKIWKKNKELNTEPQIESLDFLYFRSLFFCCFCSKVNYWLIALNMQCNTTEKLVVWVISCLL